MFYLTISDEKKTYILNEFQDTACIEQAFWLSNQDGEGMSLSRQNLFDLIDQYFRKNF